MELLENNRSTDVKISWQTLENCEYQVQIRDVAESGQNIVLHCQEPPFKYRCQRPGSVYEISVRAIRDSAYGKFSLEKPITLCKCFDMKSSGLFKFRFYITWVSVAE